MVMRGKENNDLKKKKKGICVKIQHLHLTTVIFFFFLRHA